MERNGERTRSPALLLAVLVVAAFACGAAWYGFRRSREAREVRLHQLVSSQIQTVAELVTVKNTYSSVAAVHPRRGVFKIAKFTGVIRAGIPDVQAVRIQVSEDGRAASVRLPHAQILENSLTSQELFDENNGIFTKVSTQDLFDEIAQAMKEQEAAFLASGALSEADSQAAALLEAMLTGCGFESVQVRYFTE